MNIFHSVIKNIKLSNIEKHLIDFIIEKPQEFIYMTISTFSKDTFVSVGAISKFVKKMGFKTFKHFQIYVAQEITRSDVNKIVSLEENIEDHIENIKIYHKLALETTSTYIDKEGLLAAAKLLQSANLVMTYGVGDSKLSSSVLAKNLNVIGKNTKHMQNIHDFILWTDLNKKNKTVVVLYSNTLETAEVVNMLNLCEEYKIPTIVITRNRKRREKLTTLIIRYNTFENDNDNDNPLKAFTPKISQLYVTDVLSSWVFHNNKYDPTKIARPKYMKK